MLVSFVSSGSSGTVSILFSSSSGKSLISSCVLLAFMAPVLLSVLSEIVFVLFLEEMFSLEALKFLLLDFLFNSAITSVSSSFQSQVVGYALDGVLGASGIVLNKLLSMS